RDEAVPAGFGGGCSGVAGAAAATACRNVHAKGGKWPAADAAVRLFDDVGGGGERTVSNDQIETQHRGSHPCPQGDRRERSPGTLRGPASVNGYGSFVVLLGQVKPVLPVPLPSRRVAEGTARRGFASAGRSGFCAGDLDWATTSDGIPATGGGFLDSADRRGERCP